MACHFTIEAQVYPQWIKNLGSYTGSEYVNYTAMDERGYLYVLGKFNSTFFNGNFLESDSGSDDLFFAKYSPNNTLVWIKRMGGYDRDFATGISINDGKIIIVGGFYKQINFNTPSNPFVNNLNANANNDRPNIFIAEFDTDGNFSWAKKIESYGKINIIDFKLTNNAIYLAGSVSETANFSTNNTPVTLSTEGLRDGFLAKYDLDGNLIWVNKVGGLNEDFATSVSTTADAIYLGGSYEGSINVQTPQALHASVLVNTLLDHENYLIKFGHDGQFKWAKGTKIGSNLFEYPQVRVYNEEIYTLSVFTSTTNFNTFGVEELVSMGSTDFAVIKYDSSGTLQWARRFGNSEREDYLDLNVTENFISIHGSFRGKLNFDSPVNNNIENLIGTEGIFEGAIIRYDKNGTYIDAKRAGGSKSAVVKAAQLHDDRIKLAGEYDSDINFNTPSNSTINNLSASSKEIFLADYEPKLSFKWEKGIGNDIASGGHQALAQDTDQDGNIYVTGYFTDAISFSGNSLTSEGGRDIFIAKYDRNGNALWAKRAGGSGEDRGLGIKYHEGMLYITGSFEATATFRTPHQPGQNQLVSDGMKDVFLWKIRSLDGITFWQKRFGGDQNDEGASVYLVGSEVFVTGYFSDEINFNNTNDPYPNQITSLGMEDIFVAKYNTSSSLIWAIRSGGVGSDEGKSIFVNEFSIYLGGSFEQSVSFGAGIEIISAGESDGLLARLNPANGALFWVKRMGGVGTDEVTSLAFESGDVFVTGFFEQSANFLTPSNMSLNPLVSAGLRDIFIAKYNSLGVFLWRSRAGGTQNDLGTGIAVKNSKVYITGNFRGVINFNTPSNFGTNELVSEGQRDFYLASYDLNGQFLEANRGGGTSDDASQSISFDGNFVNLVGFFNGLINFNTPSDYSSHRLNATSVSFIFVAKAFIEYQFKSAISDGYKDGDNSDPYALAVDADGNTYVTGEYYSYLDFGTLQLEYDTNDKLSYLAKLNPKGSIIWAKQIGQNGLNISDLRVLGTNVYLLGHFEGSHDFIQEGNVINITAEGNKSDMFLISINQDGDFNWAKRGGGVGYEYASSIDTDGTSLYISGKFEETANFNTPSSFGSNELISAGKNDIFLAKYDTNGNIVWLRRAGGVESESCYDLSVSNGHVFTLGSAKGQINFNTPSNFSNNSITLTDMVVVFSFTTNGVYEWVKTVSGSAQAKALVATNNALYITGYSTSAGILNFSTPYVAGVNEIIATGGRDLYLAKYDHSGSFIWAKRAGGLEPEAEIVPQDIAIYNNNEIVVGGNYKYIINFNTPSASGPTDIFTLNYIEKIYLASFNENGVLNWTKNSEASFADKIYRIVADSKNIYMTGLFWGKPDLDFGEDISVKLDIKGNSNGFVSKINKCESTQDLVSPNDDVYGQNVSILSSGAVIGSNKVTPNASVEYKGASVLLNPGFLADSGTIFKAQVGGCF
jgi:hypothetical protein